MRSEYQYHLKDHLGNARVTFTSKDETEANTATLEPANATTEQGKFLRYTTAKMVNSSMFDRTNGSAPSQTLGYAQRLNGSTNEKYGLARSISVMPGDVVNAEVYAKYVDPVTSNWNATLTNLVNQVAAGTAGVVVDGANYSTSTSSFPSTYPGLQSKSDNGAPKAYLNWLVFDRNFVFLNGGFKQITTAGKEAGTDVAHERVFNTNPIVIAEPGYVYIYVSNENTTLVDVYFDDFNVTQTKSPVIATNDYYPFGLAFNSYSRENSVPNMYGYNGKEKQEELDLGWLDYGARMYMPEIARWGTIDPLSEKMRRWSPYAYAFNNPIRFIDPDGRKPVKPGEERQRSTVLDVDADGVQKVTQRSQTVKTVAIKKDGKIVGYSRTTTQSTATNTIRVKEEGGKKTWSVEQGSVNVTSQTAQLDAKGKVVSTGETSSTEMSQSEYKASNDQKGGNSLHDLETTSDRVATLSNQFQNKYHSVIMNLNSAQSKSKDPSALVGSSYSGVVGEIYGNFTKSATAVSMVEYHSTTSEGSTKPQLLYYSNQNTGQHYDFYNPFGY